MQLSETGGWLSELTTVSVTMLGPNQIHVIINLSVSFHPNR